ncbi:IS30 family transposase [Bordetella trematum]|uniref:IS30 family transposase n=1 Tax=Bordetella trematum TaxID=123899 RepID=UPI003AF3B1C2
MRTQRIFRHARLHHAAVSGGIAESISIHARPAEIADLTLPGHWEGDLIAGTDQSAIVTIADRSTRFTVLCKINDKRAEAVTHVLVEQMRQLPTQLRKSLTWDRGVELSAHRRSSMDTKWPFTSVIRAAPGNEGPTKTRTACYADISPKKNSRANYTQNDLNEVVAKLKACPRKTLGFKAPAEALDEQLH